MRRGWSRTCDLAAAGYAQRVARSEAVAIDGGASADCGLRCEASVSGLARYSTDSPDPLFSLSPCRLPEIQATAVVTVRWRPKQKQSRANLECKQVKKAFRQRLLNPRANTQRGPHPIYGTVPTKARCGQPLTKYCGQSSSPCALTAARCNAPRLSAGGESRLSSWAAPGASHGGIFAETSHSIWYKSDSCNSPQNEIRM